MYWEISCEIVIFFYHIWGGAGIWTFMAGDFCGRSGLPQLGVVLVFFFLIFVIKPQYSGIFATSIFLQTMQSQNNNVLYISTSTITEKWNLHNCVIIWEKEPHVVKKLNWGNSIGTCSFNFPTTCTLQNEDIFKIVDFIPKWLLTNDGIAKLII